MSLESGAASVALDVHLEDGGMVHSAFDEAVTSGLQRNRTTMEILTDLLRAEATHRHAASIRYRMSAAKLPVVKDSRCRSCL